MNTPLTTRSKKRKADAEVRNAAMDIVLKSGYVSYFPDIERIQIVCKDWKELIQECKEKIVAWDRVIEYINQVNGANKCHSCEKRITGSRPCSGSFCNYGEEFDILAEMDPRRKDDYEGLGKYERARRMIIFHVSCVENLLSLYGGAHADAFTTRESTLVQWEFIDDFFFGMGSLAKYNPKVYWLLMSVVELDMAQSELAHVPFHYTEAFAGLDCNPYTGSSWGNCMHGAIEHYVSSSKPLRADERTIRVQDWGHYSPSQIDQLDNVLREVLTTRDHMADSLFGEALADRMNVFYPVRKRTLSRFDEIFPLQRMPLHEDDFVPPGPYDHLRMGN